MKTKAIVVSFACLLAVLFLPVLGRAQSTDCTQPTGLVSDGRLAPPGSTFFIGNGVQQWFVLNRLKANRSYSVEITFTFGGDVGSMPNSSLFENTGFDGVACTGTAVTSRTTQGIDPASDRSFGNVTSRRRSFTLTTSQDVRMTITNGTGVGFSYNVTVSETTLFNPLWSTFGGFETFYKIYNTTATSCSVTLDLRSDADASVASVTFSVAGNNTSATRNTGPTDLNVADNQAGHAVITHDCPPGAIQADGFLRTVTIGGIVVLPIKIVVPREATH